jgi:flagellar hook protein FlgE
MLRSLYSGVSGLKNHQIRMDIIGNNIANVNTVGFKASRVVFQDIYSQTLSPASAPTATSGGTNPMQVGLGVTVSTVDVMHTRTGSTYTGNPTDVSVEGDGFFVVNEAPTVPGTPNYYTRAGNFSLDTTGHLVTSDGLFVMGYPSPLPAPLPAALSQITIPANVSNVSIDKNGNVTGINAANTKITIGTIALATFTNQNGLEKMGGSLYDSTANSGVPAYTNPGAAGAATLNAGALEMSNVDLSNEFTDMIITQRGFQANARIITTSDSLLEELVNQKRS